MALRVTSLAGERCSACHAGTPPLTDDEIAALSALISDRWAVRGGTTLRRELRTRDFADAFALATAVASAAESEGHHPDLEVGWGRLVISTTTHAIRALTRNDFILAAKLDAILPGSSPPASAPPAP
ncbi:MAG: 4a-hydroxytetrahydrobiopterin dehydratase [Candidatus Dormibacteria bacterium]